MEYENRRDLLWYPNRELPLGATSICQSRDLLESLPNSYLGKEGSATSAKTGKANFLYPACFKMQYQFLSSWLNAEVADVNVEVI